MLYCTMIEDRKYNHLQTFWLYIIKPCRHGVEVADATADILYQDHLKSTSVWTCWHIVMTLHDLCISLCSSRLPKSRSWLPRARLTPWLEKEGTGFYCESTKQFLRLRPYFVFFKPTQIPHPQVHPGHIRVPLHF